MIIYIHTLEDFLQSFHSYEHSYGSQAPWQLLVDFDQASSGMIFDDFLLFLTYESFYASFDGLSIMTVIDICWVDDYTEGLLHF